MKLLQMEQFVNIINKFILEFFKKKKNNYKTIRLT
jgi:hypothetical protein